MNYLALEVAVRAMIRELLSGDPGPGLALEAPPPPEPDPPVNQPRFDFVPEADPEFDPMAAAKAFMERGELPPDAPEKSAKAKRVRERLFPEERTTLYPEPPTE